MKTGQNIQTFKTLRARTLWVMTQVYRAYFLLEMHKIWITKRKQYIYSDISSIFSDISPEASNADANKPYGYQHAIRLVVIIV